MNASTDRNEIIVNLILMIYAIKQSLPCDMMMRHESQRNSVVLLAKQAHNSEPKSDDCRKYTMRGILCQIFSVGLYVQSAPEWLMTFAEMIQKRLLNFSCSIASMAPSLMYTMSSSSLI